MNKNYVNEKGKVNCENEGNIEKENFKKYLKNIEDEITILNSSLKLYEYLNKSLKEHKKAMEQSPFFYNIVFKALLSYFFIGISKLYENYERNRSDFDLKRLINYIEVNQEKIFNKKIQSGVYERQRGYIKDKENIIKKILGWRDKYLTHNTKKIIEGRELISEKYPVNKQDLIELIDVAEKIINEYCELDGMEKPIYEIINYEDIENTFYIVEKNLNK